MYPSPYAGSGPGAGGKIRRRPTTRAASTPYERPPAAAAAHRLAAAAAAASASSGEGGGGGSGGSGGWVSRLVDPASRLIAGGAARLFSSVFRKRLAPQPAPSSPPGRNNDPTQDLPDSTNVDSPPLPEGGMDKGENIAATSDGKALSEVEHLLMRKTFTRVEFDRLTDLLRARTIESDPPAPIVLREDKNEGIRIDGIGGSTSHQVAADKSPTVKVHSHGASSPAELAKQYMSSRYSREPQSSNLRNRLFLENKGEVSNTAYDRRFGPPTEFGNENPGLPVNGYVTSGLRGRSAIYRMSRSPYFKAPSSSEVNRSSLSQQAQSLHASGRQVMKRRGGDLENEVGSIGPIRRIRQKSNMMSPFRDAHSVPRGNLLTSRTSGSDFIEGSTSIQESPSSKRLLLGTSQSVRPLESHKSGDGKPSDGAPSIPAQSNKMAEKIFEQLNIIAPSPKEKQSGQHSVTGNANNSMSKKPILQDAGPSSMYDPSSSLKFQDLDGANGPLDPDLNGSLLKKDKLNIIKDGPSKIALSDKSTFLGNSVSASTSRKPGFKMAVIEDLPELDDDLEVPIPSKSPSRKIEVETTGQKSESVRKEQKVEQNILEQKVESNLLKNIVGSPVSEQPVASLSKTVSSSGGLLSSNDAGKAVPNVSVDTNTGFALSKAPPGTRPASVSAIPLAPVSDDKQTGTSNSVFGLKQSNTSDLEALNVKNKSTLGQSVTKLTTSVNSSERGDKTEKADVIKSSDKVLPSAAPTTLSAPLHFTSAASTSASLSNGFSHSSSPKLATVPPTDKPSAGSVASTLFAVSSSNPAISSSSSAPAFTAFNFSSGASVGLSSAKSDGTTAGVKPASTLSFGIGGATDDAKSTAPNSASTPPSKLTSPISSSPVTSAPTFSPVVASSDAAGSAAVAPLNTSTASGVQAASTASFTFGSSGNNLSGFSSPAQSTGLSTSSAAGSTSQPSAATSTFFGSKPTQSEGTIQQPSPSPKPQFGSPFPSVTPGVGTSSSGSGTLSFGIGASVTGSGTMTFGVGASSSTPGTSSAFGAAAPSSGPGIFSFGAGTSTSGSGTVSLGVGATSSGPGTVSFGAGSASSGPGAGSFGAGTSSSGSGTVTFGVGAASSGPGTVSFGAGTASSGPGTVSFGAGAASSGPGTVSFGAGASSSGPGTVTFGVGAASSGPGTVSFGAGAASSGSGTVSFGAGASSSGPGTVSFGATSTTGTVFGNSPFGSGATFANPFNSSSGTGFTFSSASSSAGASTVASTSVFATTSTASPASTFNNPFSSSSSPPSTFTFGQSASSSGGFAFGAQPASTFSSQPSVFSFTSANASMNPSTPQPAFGMTNTAFGMSSPGNDQMNEDSMADDTNQAAPAPAPIFGSPFGQQNSTPAAPVFGAPAVQPGGAFQFGGQQQAAQQNPSFPAAGSLEFQGGNFSLGSGGGGGDKSSRRMIKVKRAPKKR